MSIVKCPGCQADLELPPAGGTRVVCPYCETEFAPGAAAAPRRTRPGGRQNVRGRRYEEEYDDGGYGRGGYRKRTDPTPFIIIGICVLVLGGALAYFLTKGKERDERREQQRMAEMASKVAAHFPPPQPLPVSGDSYRFFSGFEKGDKITFRRMDYNGRVTYEDSVGSVDVTEWTETYSIHGEITCETVIAKEGETATHEGNYEIKSFRKGPRGSVVDHVYDPVAVKLQFQTDGLGKLVPGSYTRVDGAALAEWPKLMGERGFGVLDGGSHRQGERWGAATLPDSIIDRIHIDGVNLRSVPMIDGGRQGGWYIKGGKPVKLANGKWDKREAHLLLRLSAVQNHRQMDGRYKGEKADISIGIRWMGGATYELGKRMISHIEGLMINVEVVIKTRKTWYHWSGSEHLDTQIFKDS
jgi:hypothetical protein